MVINPSDRFHILSLSKKNGILEILEQIIKEVK
jgi:hypothetical protein